MNIIALETQNHGQDWPMIVMAVPCPICSAPPLERCRTVRADNPQTNHLIQVGLERADWHAERKYAAARAWYAQRDKPTPTAEDLDAVAADQTAKENTDTSVPAPAQERPRSKKGSVKK